MTLSEEITAGLDDATSTAAIAASVTGIIGVLHEVNISLKVIAAYLIHKQADSVTTLRQFDALARMFTLNLDPIEKPNGGRS